MIPVNSQDMEKYPDQEKRFADIREIYETQEWHDKREANNVKLSPEYLGKKDQYEEAFLGVEKFCIFIGHPRSGHSLVGSLLDAHPQMIISHELDVLKYIKQGYSETEIYHLILNNSQRNISEGRTQTGYNYNVPNQWQGKFQALKVIGDKKGGKTTRDLKDNLFLLDNLHNTISQPIHFINVIRNPYDNITAMLIRGAIFWDASTLESCTKHYFSMCEVVRQVKEKIDPDQFYTFRHEDLVANPSSVLRELCNFLGQSAPKDYLIDCASMMFKSPQRTRDKVQWSDREIELVATRIKEFDFLDGYSYQ